MSRDNRLVLTDVGHTLAWPDGSIYRITRSTEDTVPAIAALGRLLGFRSV
jgi:hypothetical protein